MKKFLAILLAGLMIFSLCACEKDGEKAGKESEETSGGMNEAYFTAIEKLNEAYVKGDGETVFAFTVDPHTLEKNIDAGVYENEDDALEMGKEHAEETKDRLYDIYGKGVKVTTEHIKTTKYEKDDVATVNEYLEDMGYDENYISDLCLVKVKETLEGKDDINVFTPSYVVAKIDGKWYVDVLPGLYGEDSIKDITRNYN